MMSLMISQHWSRKWLDVVKQQANIAQVYYVIQHHLATMGYKNIYIYHIHIWQIQTQMGHSDTCPMNIIQTTQKQNY